MLGRYGESLELEELDQAILRLQVFQRVLSALHFLLYNEVLLVLLLVDVVLSPRSFESILYGILGKLYCDWTLLLALCFFD
jgi:hypothetical protein